MKKEEAFALVNGGTPVYLIALAYCHTKLIGQRILRLDKKPGNLQDFLANIKVFKEVFRQDMRPARPSDKLLSSFYSEYSKIRRYLFKYVKELPKSCGIISSSASAQTGT